MTSTPLGAVLAGGESRRLGRDKALLACDGRALAARAVALLAAAFPRVVLVAPARPGYAELGAPLVADRWPGHGPLAGLEAALAAADGAPVFALACDLPLVDLALVRELAAAGPAFAAGPAARLAEADGRLQPLCGLYSPGCRPWFERCLANGVSSVREALRGVRVESVAVGARDALSAGDRLLNVNRQADVERLRRLEGAGAP